jgi:uncharacterized protein YaiE (UPF0345 family)
MKKTLVFLAVALVIPTSVAMAKSNPKSHGKAAPRVMYVLKGSLSGYTAATTSADGSISITVNHSNYHGRALKGQTLTFSTTMNTRVTMVNGATQITDGAKGVLKFKAPLRVPANTPLATMLTGSAKALHIIDQSRH